MSYLVLARKWRPRRFAELVGQEHVVRALSNALESNRVHHAYLFTGTRGVGKTTIARIFAKSLNCEKGVGADPCGECAVCAAVDAGRFVDLLEIDAASNTGVDDVRGLIENAQYMPTRGRYKVYLIDEVHMLSKAAFNALLKTLEEPPEHVKFLLATTDPDKLPVTVLSRCLQFNLKRLSEEQISAHMQQILAAETIDAETVALNRLAHAADGSLRDGLSLLDQAIAFGGGKVTEVDVDSMLGTVDRGHVDALLLDLAAADATSLLANIEHHASYSPEFGSTLEALAERLHQVQLQQLAPGTGAVADVPADALVNLPAETVQLWYQMAINGRRDLPFAPSPRIGFEMALLRMLAFHPEHGPDAGSANKPDAGKPSSSHSNSAPSSRADTPRAAIAPSTATASHVAAQLPTIPASDHDALPTAPISHRAAKPETRPATRIAEPPPAASAMPAPTVAADSAPPPAANIRGIGDNEQWVAMLSEITLRGPVRELAGNAVFVSLISDQLRLALPKAYDMLRNDMLTEQLADALATHLGLRPQIRFEEGAANADSHTLSARDRAERAQRQQDAEAEFLANPAVQGLINDFGARTVSNSIRPSD